MLRQECWYQYQRSLTKAIPDTDEIDDLEIHGCKVRVEATPFTQDLIVFTNNTNNGGHCDMLVWCIFEILEITNAVL